METEIKPQRVNWKILLKSIGAALLSGAAFYALIYGIGFITPGMLIWVFFGLIGLVIFSVITLLFYAHFDEGKDKH